MGVFGVCGAAKDHIIDTGLVLKSNESLAIDGRKNRVAYVLEILPSGRIIRRNLTQKEKESIGRQGRLLGQLEQKARIESQAQQKVVGADIFDNTIHKQRNISEWDKHKIRYEQEVQRIDIGR